MTSQLEIWTQICMFLCTRGGSPRCSFVSSSNLFHDYVRWRLWWLRNKARPFGLFQSTWPFATPGSLGLRATHATRRRPRRRHPHPRETWGKCTETAMETIYDTNPKSVVNDNTLTLIYCLHCRFCKDIYVNYTSTYIHLYSISHQLYNILPLTPNP